ncbi:hypothetical protein GLIP_0173 [Aliiglaciecola lipolytica E3]|uniref:Uncharacterized protein n=1 Tax=Aliiglaciecola lipolytica E3 TaxID=1127673 RepID=K6Y3K6_9ALTE|nr:hypothetical protein GLIP_0173 [Aliiglaciecola lipolytica E3]
MLDFLCVFIYSARRFELSSIAQRHWAFIVNLGLFLLLFYYLEFRFDIYRKHHYAVWR